MIIKCWKCVGKGTLTVEQGAERKVVVCPKCGGDGHVEHFDIAQYDSTEAWIIKTGAHK